MHEALVFELLGRLIDGWCDRRALRPLSALLPAYIGFARDMDAWSRLSSALHDARGVGRPELLDGELTVLDEAIALTAHVLHARGAIAS